MIIEARGFYSVAQGLYSATEGMLMADIAAYAVFHASGRLGSANQGLRPRSVGGTSSLLGRLSFSLALLGVILGSAWQLLARFGALLDAQSRPKCNKNGKLLTS